MNKRRFLWVPVLALLVALVSTTFAEPREGSVMGGSEQTRFDVGLIGDLPYDAEGERRAANLFEELNGERLAFVAHDGDIKSGESACVREVYEKEFERFEGSDNPLVYTPGDNEWTDCHRTPNPTSGEADPLDRLDLVRRTFFATDGSLGERNIPLERQGDGYPENARWQMGGARGVTFATLHVVGSNNNRPTELPDGTVVGNRAEYRARNEANIAWLRETFDEASRSESAAVMLVIQANVFEEDVEKPSGFAAFKEALKRETIAFGKPVVLVHGDSHYFRIDKPLYAEDGDAETRIPNFTRVETFGDTDVHWVRATVDTRDPEVFTFRQEIVEENTTP